MATPYEEFVNRELPRRPVMLTYTITGYDGDPNAVIAPTIVSNAPAGSFYLEQTTRILWRKSAETSGSFVEVGTGEGVETTEDLACTVDYEDVSSVDPPIGTVFTTQSQIDQFLSDHSATAFKHLQAIWDAIPWRILHNITINLSAGVHRPQPVPTYANVGCAWFFQDKCVDHRALISINGPMPSTWTAVDPLLNNLTITGYQIGTNPYLDFSGTPFLGFSLKGMFAVLSTGQVVVIHEHTDSRLYVCSYISPDPTGGTVKVARPAAILRNSLDDVTSVTWYDVGIGPTPQESFFSIFMFELNNIRFQGVASNIQLLITNGSVEVMQCELDCLTYTPNMSGVWAWSTVQVFFMTCSFIAASSGPDNAFTVQMTAFVGIYNSFVKGWDDGIGVSTQAMFDADESVLELNGPIIVADGSVIFASWGGKVSELRGFGLYFKQGYYTPTYGDISTAPTNLIFKNIASSCIRIGSNCEVDFSTSILSDGGGNLGCGFEFFGESSSVKLGPGVTLSGASGDAKMADSDVWSYADIVSLGPIIDDHNNIVRKDS